MKNTSKKEAQSRKSAWPKFGPGRSSVFSDETPEDAIAKGRHVCRASGKPGEWGAAYEYCQEAPDGRLFVANAEYETGVRFCPECGKNAAKAG